MSFNEDESNDLTFENMEEEDKVNIEETSVNLGYVKKELVEEEFEENQYKIALTFENMFGKSLIDQGNNRDSLIGFLDGNVIMKTESIKLEDVKEENDHVRKTIEQCRCNKCAGNYQGYCLNCSSLSHILNNLNPNLNPEPDLNTTPINMLEVREILSKRVVFALKTIPKGIVLGPFEGIAPIKSTTGLRWKIKNKKIANDENGNWMKYIDSVANSSSRNLDVFQLNGILYFETSREIQEGEELLVCYCVEHEKKSEKEEESYLVPVKKEEHPQVFACTFCCLGFSLKTCLVEHKGNCPQGVYGSCIEDFEIIQCRCCKVWLEKQEHLESHMLLCLEKYNTLYRNLPHFQRKTADEIQRNGEISTPFDQNRGDLLSQTEVIHSKYSNGIGKAHKRGNFSEKKHKCSECSYQTIHKHNLGRHLYTHNNIKPFECNVCKTRFTEKGTLKRHIISKHSNEKEYKCSECSYETNRKNYLNVHLNTHKDIKPFECGFCKKRFNRKGTLKAHIKNHHSNTNEKEYKCFECSYQTNDKSHFNRHSNTHKNKETEYKCPECFYQTNYKHHLSRHINAHNDIKPLKCDICTRKFKKEDSLNKHLKAHIKNQHSNTNEKEYKCSESSHQTNDKSNLNRHSNTSKDKEKEYKFPECSYETNRKEHLKHFKTHKGIKPFECDACKRKFTQKRNLKQHIINQHSNTTEKEYKCFECSYQTNRKYNLQVHLSIHKDIKPFECDVCKKKFKQRPGLNQHTRNKHSKTSEKE